MSDLSDTSEASKENSFSISTPPPSPFSPFSPSPDRYKQHYIIGITSLVRSIIIIITQTAAIALEPLTTHPDEWAEPSHK